MSQEEEDAEDVTLVTLRTMDIIVALLLMLFSGIVIFDSVRVGHGWAPGLGPAAGYFPFYVASFLGIASVITLVKAIFSPQPGWSHAFVTKTSFGRVLSVLVPAFIFVALIGYLGLYVASALFIIGFMIIVGRDNPLLALAVGIGVPLALFFMFERWFLVPLPKGPLEAMLGY